MTKKEAEAEVVKKKSIPPKGYCPLMNDSCVQNCACYQGWYAEKHSGTSEDDYYVTGGHCANAMLMGNTVSGNAEHSRAE